MFDESNLTSEELINITKVMNIFKVYYSRIPDLISELGMDMYGTDGRTDLAKYFVLAHFENENTKAIRDQ